MKIEINISKITDSPYSPELKDSFLIEDNEPVNRLVRELNIAHPSTFLVSGYRGAGKTSFINQVIEVIGNDTIHVNLSLAKFDGYSTLVKKLVRQLHLSFENSSRKDENVLKEVRDKLKLLYDRTFHDVIHTQKNSFKNETNSSSEISFDLKKLIPFLFVGASGSITAFDLLKHELASYGLFLISLIWVFISSWQFKKKKTNTDSHVEESARKTLYDDEIAEHYLFNILKELKQLGVKTLIVFDELDKIQPPEAVNTIINELKSLLLSGNSNFIVIAGQGLYYQFEKSQTADDSILSSLFSKTIHIPFLKYTSLKKYCLELVDDETVKKNELFNNYFDTLILHSARIPRRLSNLIRSKLIWDSEKPYLMIEDSQKEIYSLEARLLKVTTKVLDSELPKITKNLVKQDFFISQIHLWIFKIKTLKPFQFNIGEVVKQESYKEQEYPTSYINELHSLCRLLFERLIDEGVLESDIKDDSIYFSWTIEQKGGSDISQPSLVTSPNFVNEFAELEHYIRGIYVDIVDGATIDNSKLSVKQMLNELINLEALSKSWYNSTIIESIIETRNKVVHGKSIEKDDLNIIQNSRFDIGRLKAELIEEYTYYVSKKYLTEYEVQKENKGGFDFIANKESVSIVFEVKYLQYGLLDTRNINEIIDKFTNYLQTVSANSFYILFFYQPNGRKSYDSFYTKFFDIINEKLPKLSHRFMLYYISEYKGDTSSGRLKTYLDQVLSKIEEPEIQPQNESSIDGIYVGLFKNAEKEIKEKAKKDWPDDYDMQVYEINKQEEAIKKLIEGKPKDISDSNFKKIRSKAKKQWSSDYDMRVHEEQKQFEAIRKLK